MVQAINSNGQPVTLALPLGEFAKAFDGPPTDPKEFEAAQKKLQEELQKRAEEARKKLEANSPAGGAPRQSGCEVILALRNRKRRSDPGAFFLEPND